MPQTHSNHILYIPKISNILQNGGYLKKNPIFTQKFVFFFFQFEVVHRQMTHFSNLYRRVVVDWSNTFQAVNRAILKNVKPRKTRLKIYIVRIVGKSKFLKSYGFSMYVFGMPSYRLSQKKIDFLDSLHGIPLLMINMVVKDIYFYQCKNASVRSVVK